MNKHELYLSILNEYVHEDSAHETRKWMTKPSLSGDKTIATDAHILVAFPKFGEFAEAPAMVGAVYPKPHNVNKEIPLSHIESLLAEYPMVDCFDEKESTCDACYGCGEVDFEFDHGRRTYTTSAECPVCEGEGIACVVSKTPNGKKEIDGDRLFKIGVCTFKPSFILALVSIAKKLSVDTITIIHQEAPHKPCVFAIGEAEVFMMPVLNGDERKLGATIEI
jgi:hypothetical protein